MAYIYSLFYFCLILQVEAVKNCPSENGIHLFGDKCNFMCHCKDKNDECDVTSGECTSGCARGWFGPGCQYRNLAAKGQTGRNPDHATDGDVTTCSETRKSWSVQFNTYELITEIHIVTKPDKLNLFKRFTVTVHDDKGHPRECYRHGNEAPKQKRIVVICNNRLFGKKVTINLAEMKTLVLCDVEINGGRNLAFKRKASQISVHQPCNTKCTPEKAVDGHDNGRFWTKCSFTRQEDNPWWRVDLVYLARIRMIQIVSLSDCIEDMCGYDCKKTCHFQNASIQDKMTGHCSETEEERDCDGRHCSKKCSDNCSQRCAPGSYGNNCEGKCSKHCKYGDKRCNRITGHCHNGCKHGWTGQLCDKAVCNRGWYGQNCNTRCSQNCVKQECNNTDGRCTNGCTPGWTGESCQKICNAGTFGIDCKSNCPSNCKHGTCHHVNGRCSSGCKSGYREDKCDKSCAQGEYGQNCSKHCNNNCLHGNKYCNKVNGHCLNGCKAGWKGSLCNQGCAQGEYGQNCSNHCNNNCLRGNKQCNKVNGQCLHGCKAGWKVPLCDQGCAQGEYGQNCSNRCSDNCFYGNKHCNKFNGHCVKGCRAGWEGQLCDQECGAGTFGVECKSNCSSNCKIRTCHHVNGKCSSGCKPGYIGEKCERNCTVGYFGKNCGEDCSRYNCKDGYQMCSNIDGHCLNGCQAGWNGKWCDSVCKTGTFGIGCKNKCPSNCKDDYCDYSNGTCTQGCKPGYQGSVCKDDCKVGTFGENCSKNCSKHCKGGIERCRNVDGQCLGGCQAGWNGTKCFSKCDAGFYGENCTSVCGRCKSGIACNHVTGTCYGGCETGYTGDICLQATQVSNSSNMAAVGAVVAALVIIILIGVLVVFYKRRNKNKRNDEHMGNIELTQPSTSADNETRRLSNGNNNMHVNPDENSSTSADETNIYKNYPMPEQTRNPILLPKLLSYVKQNLANPQHFLNEFKGIPFGMQYSSAVANKSYNRGKNRYKDMRAYDKTRVVLKTLSNELGSDYINASFIKGHHKEKAYIAAQGPIETSVDDFWRMIWEKDVYTIVMVTNIAEQEKMKCLQYWPPVETRIRYGNTLVYTVSEVIYADFTIRNLTVSSDKEKSERNIRQFHFTSWPDKSVPLSTSSLLQFWSKVRKNDATKEHTWLVHCSAGVGRTGTFIATDILYDQGKDKGYIDVCQCVTDLRDQRVNMVQAKDQYVYLHTLMVEALLRPSQPVTLDNLHKVVRDLKTVDPTTRKTGLFLQYEALKEDMAPLYTRIAGETENMYSTAMLEENRNKNRFSSILPPNRYRTFLVSNIPGCTNYINAVHMPSYSHKQGYIVTQKPLENTVIDHYRLIYEQNVKVIVMFPDKDCMQDCAEASMSVGPFTLTKVSEEDKSFYTKRIFNMIYHKEQSKIIQLEFQNWKERQIIPREHDEMLSFMQEVELLNRVDGDKPVLVQCLDGSEKSGLFVCLMNILEHVRLDNEVSVPQVIRQLRHIRQNIIPNFKMVIKATTTTHQ